MIDRFLSWLTGSKKPELTPQERSPEQQALWSRFDEIVKDAPPIPLTDEELGKLVYALKTNQRPVYGGSGRDVYLSHSLSVVVAIFGEVTEEQIREYGGKCKTLFEVWGKLTKVEEADQLQRARDIMNEVLKRD